MSTDFIWNDLQTFQNAQNSANDTVGHLTVRDDKDFADAVRFFVETNFGVDLTRRPSTLEKFKDPGMYIPIVGRVSDINTNEKKLIDELVNAWPQNLKTEFALSNVNFGLLVREFAKTNPDFADEAEKIAAGYDEFQRKNIIEPLLTQQNEQAGRNNSDLEIETNRWLNAAKDLPLNLSLPFGFTQTGDPLTPEMAAIVNKARMNLGNVPATTATEDGSIPVESEGSDPYQTRDEQSASTSPTFGGDLQQFFDVYPQYQFIDALNQAPGYEYVGFNEFASRYGVVQTNKGSWSVLQANNWIESLDPKQLELLQDDLRVAGYFDAVGSLPRARGFLDPATTSAWQFFLADAARNNTTPVEWFKQTKTLMRQNVWDEQVQKTDPLTIKAQAGDLAMSMLGRRLNDEELVSLTDRIRDWEREFVYGSSTYARQNEQVDIGARIEDYIATNMRNEFTLANTIETMRNWDQVFN